MLEYHELIKTPIGSKSMLLLNSNKWFIQTPPGHITLVKDKLIFKTTTDKEEYNIFISKLNEINKEWKDVHFPNGKQKSIIMNSKHIIIKTNDNTEFFDKHHYLSNVKNLCKKELILIITTPNIWISKKQYGNTWNILQVIYTT
jgi:hypothetical protein|tara:strand:+ start:1519 stop:1950 length:432 start_codon:yes stop_codon:yes gene_type:complete